MKICFVSRNAYSALNGSNLEHVGGVERQLVILASWFQKKGDDVSVVTWSPGVTAKSTIDGVRLHFTCAERDGIKVLRFFHPRWTSLVRALAEADADIYYYNIGDLALGQVVAWARRAGRKAVYSVSSEMSCYGNLKAFMPLRERLLYRYGLRNADKVLTQTRVQSDLLAKHYGIPSIVIPMPGVDMRVPGSAPRQRGSGPLTVVWVGRFSPEKRAHWLLDIAEVHQQINFIVVGQANAASVYARRFVDRAAQQKNVQLRGVVPHQEMSGIYSEADLLLCTSEYEGLPNVFVEAWSAALPIVSTFDPDSILRERNLGVSCSSREDISSALERLESSVEERQQYAARGREYFDATHTMDRAMSVLDATVRGLLANERKETGTE